MSAKPRPAEGQQWERPPTRKSKHTTRLRIHAVLPMGMLEVQYRQRHGTLSYWGKPRRVTALRLLEEYHPVSVQRGHATPSGMWVGKLDTTRRGP